MGHELPKNRKGIERERAKNERDSAKRLEDAKKVVADKRITSETARKTKGGTAEGTAQAEKSYKRAGDAADKEHAKQGNELKKRVFDRAKKNEKELGKRGQTVDQDTKAIKQAKTKTETKAVVSELNDAEMASKQDKGYLDKEKANQTQDRTKKEKKLQQQEREMKRTKIEVPKK